MIENSSANAAALEMLNKTTGENDTPESILKLVFIVSLFWPVIVLILTIIFLIKYFLKFFKF
jgi:hypothetical protein